MKMKGAQLSLVILCILSSTGFSACQRPDSPSHTLNDLQVLKSRVEQTRPQYNFSDLHLLDGISQNTLDFISQRFEPTEVSSFAQSFPKIAASFGATSKHKADGTLVMQFTGSLSHFYGQMSGGGLMLEPKGMDQIPLAHLSPQAESLIAHRYTQLVSEHIHIWGDDKWEARIYCEEECLCTSQTISRDLQKLNMDLPMLYVRVSPGAGTFLKNNWTYHVALLVGDQAKGWSVVDHILFKDDELHRLADWKQALDPDSRAQYQVSVDVKGFALSRH